VRRVDAQTGNGVSGSAVLDWPRLVQFKRRFTDSLPAAFEESFSKAGATLLHGTARFTGPDSLEVAGERVSARAILVATGSVPAPLGIAGADLAIDAEAFMELPHMPRRVVFIGGGYISFEFAPMAAAAGARVTIVHRSARPLAHFDPRLVAQLIEGYRESGIDVRLEEPVRALRRGPHGDLLVELGDGREIACDLAVHGAGRIPELADLDLEAAGVDCGPAGVTVDSGMRSTSNPRVFAAGDAAAAGEPLTPVGVAQARVAIRNIVGAEPAVFDPPLVPSAVFTDPPLASVGLTERVAAEKGLSARAVYTDTSAWLSSQRVGVRHSGAVTLVEPDTGRILGGHVLCHHAEELVNVFALAIARGATVDDLKAMLWAYPTATSEIVYLFG
jgi:glutathione reductase (NADPH)